MPHIDIYGNEEIPPAEPCTKCRETEESICEMRLCEASRLILKPNQLYRFTVDKDCKLCKEAMEDLV